jgi:mycothiol synthase
MWRIETRRDVDDDAFDSISRLIADAADYDGFPPLSDHLELALAGRGATPGFAAVMAFDEDDELVGYAQLARANMSTAVEIVITPDERVHVEALPPFLLRAALDLVANDGGGQVNWWVHRPDERADAAAAEVGLRLGRRLLQLRRSLPIEETTTTETRPFEVGRDEAEWLRVNNAAFADHPEQGGWTIETLRLREAEPWFDPTGFRLYERDGVLAGFCWTKVHRDTTPPMGEIYVIAVDPSFHGLGLGKALTIAGLDHLAKNGLTVGMLHVDAANEAALGLYERLGFVVHHADHAYLGQVPASRTNATMTGARP